MAYQADMTPCTYFPGKSDDRLIAIGWLACTESFTTGNVERAVYDKLVEFSKSPWEPIKCSGPHECDLCQFEGESTGSTNVFVPDGEKVFVCPSMITHYINAHRYQPPKEFCAAVIVCPSMGSSDYRKAIARCQLMALFK